MNYGLQFLKLLGRGVLLLASVAACSAQNSPLPTRVWSVGPLSKSAPVMGGVIVGSGTVLTGLRADGQTGSIFAATRRVVFARDRIVIASIADATEKQVWQLFSLDVKTGEIKNSREFVGFGVRAIFATDDGHIVVSGSSVLRLTPDLTDDGSFDYHATGHRFGRVQNISPDGSTLGNATSPGFELIDVHTLKATTLTESPLVDTSVSSKAVVSDSPRWFKDYPKAKSFATLTDQQGQHLIFHGDCGGRPQFLRDDRVLTASCKIARILDTQGNILKTITLHDFLSFAGVSQNGKRFALQVATFSGMHEVKHESFVIYSVDTGEPVAEVAPDVAALEQSWSALSPDGSMIVVGSPAKLTLYRLP